jgi:hypothetical protein
MPAMNKQEIKDLNRISQLVLENALNLCEVINKQGFKNLPPETRSLMSLDQKVLVRSGISVSPKYAAELGVPADIIFIRNDGRALGAPYALAHDAYSLWPDDWTHFYDAASKELNTIDKYVQYIIKFV